MTDAAPRRRMAVAPERPTHLKATAFESVALVLQGGGALGAYQAGIFEKLHEAAIEPTWVAGISIGAINSALIAGNRPEDRVDRLREFWQLVSDAGDGGIGHLLTSHSRSDTARRWTNQLAAARVAIRGVPGFFEPRFPPAYLLPLGGGATSYYDSSRLKATLERLVDFDRINRKEMRFSVGAVNVRTGNFAYFDNETDTIRAEHVMASGALPPALPAVEIDGEFYWDGGMVSNTPLDWVLSARPGTNTLVFQVDLWSARGRLPGDLTEVAVRMKEVQYSSRTRAATDEFRRVQALRAAFNTLLPKMPAKLAATTAAKLLAEEADPTLYNIVQMIYRSATYEGESKDYEFSRRTMEEHWAAGYDDATRTLSHREVLELPSAAVGLAVYDFCTKREGASTDKKRIAA